VHETPAFRNVTESGTNSNHRVLRFNFIILQIEPTWCTIFLNICVAFLYMFRAAMCLSSGKNTVPMRHLVFVTLCR
jgi:hypothetical protein